MDYFGLSKKEQIGVEINGACSHTGKKGVIVGVDVNHGITKDTLVEVKINGRAEPAKLRILCFKNCKSVVQNLSFLN